MNSATALELATANSTSTPNPPTDVTATTVSSTEIRISWTDNSDNENGFMIRRMNGGSWIKAGGRPANREAFSDTGLDPDTDYQYQVRACHSSACGDSDIFFGTTGDSGQSDGDTTHGPDDDVTDEIEDEVAENGEEEEILAPRVFPVSGSVPAFPGAEGWGATALNESRRLPLQVHVVTNTADSGPGTLHEAIQNTRSDRYDIITFQTGGVIRRRSDELYLGNSHVYIAGQTAPGDGVAIDGRGGVTMWIRGGGGNISDIAVRFLRIRGASTSIDISKGDRIILDHLSLSWASRYLLAVLRYEWSWSDPVSNVSIQNTLLSEVLNEHPTAVVVGSGGTMKEDELLGLTNVSFHRNLMASNSQRNPMTAADNAVIANNVIFNWRNAAGVMNRRGTVDWTNNLAKPGRMTVSNAPYLVNAYCDELGGDFSIYAAGNVGPASTNANGDNWTDPTRQVACMRNSGDYENQEVPSKWRRTTPQGWRNATFPINLRSAAAAYDVVVNDVGANARVTCDGTWVSAMDSEDARVIAYTKNGTGPSRSHTSVGSWPSYDRGTPCPDTDNDGLPDAWEERYFGSRTGARPDAVGSNGYLLIEHYVNGTNPN